MNILKRLSAIFMAVVFAAALFGCKATSPLPSSTSDTQTKEAAQGQAAAASQTQEAGSYTEEEITEKIAELVARQETAIITADTELMEETINPADAWLRLEARHLAADQKVWPVSDYKRTVSDITKQGAYYVGTVTQSFVFQGEKKESREQRYFMLEDGAAYDMGTALEKAKAGIVFIAFPEGNYDFAKSLGDTVSGYVAAVNQMWDKNFRDPDFHKNIR